MQDFDPNALATMESQLSYLANQWESAARSCREAARVLGEMRQTRDYVEQRKSIIADAPPELQSWLRATLGEQQ